jgi:putative hemolysin
LGGTDPKFELRRATSQEDIRAAQRLRYRVFVEELGADGPMVDHAARLERDRFDCHFDHLILYDTNLPPDDPDRAVGVYRVMRSDQAEAAGQFYSEDEYDLSALKTSGRRLLELGRSCVDARYRGGTAMFHLWNGLARYVVEHRIEVLFGVASFHGTDVSALAEPLSYLHHHHLAPEPVRVRVLPRCFQRMDLVREDEIDRRRCLVAIPALIKAYLRLGGFVGEGAYIDHAFNTTDVCLVMDTERMNASYRDYYTRGGAA